MREDEKTRLFDEGEKEILENVVSKIPHSFYLLILAISFLTCRAIPVSTRFLDDECRSD